MNLEELLRQLSLYGNPALFKHKDGWRCKCDMLVTGLGVEFSIASDFNQPTAHNAVQQCYDRMTEALATLSEHKAIGVERKLLT